MQATRLWVACLPVLVAASVAACDDSEDAILKPSCRDCGHLSAGMGGVGGPAPSAASGSSSGGSGGSSQAHGGAAAAPSSGGAAGDADDSEAHGGQTGSGGAAGSGAGAGEATAGETGSPTTDEQLEFCARLVQQSQDADAVARGYVRALFLDCRVKWLVPRGQDLATFLNQVVSFSYNLWGCENTTPVNTFGLVLATPALSQGDVNVLIELYMTPAQGTLELSPLEHQSLEAALIRLSKPLVSDASLDPSQSACPVGAGGAGGATTGAAP
jgi:hypothetical protein